MITLLTGENSFEITRVLKRLVDEFDGTAERIDGAELEERQLPDLLAGATLFSDKRLVVIKGLSENKQLWSRFGEWLERASPDVDIILVDEKPDKRTKTYKELKAVAKVHEFAAWGERDGMKAETWVAHEAEAMGVTLDRKNIQALVYRVGPDQWQLHHALSKLSLLEEVTVEAIEELIEATPTENIFNLLDTALKGDGKKASEMLRILERTEDPYMVFGLLCSQAFQLAALAASDGSGSEVAKDIGAHPFALQKLAPHANRLGRGGARRIIESFARADDRLKSGPADPWVLIDQALARIATL